MPQQRSKEQAKLEQLQTRKTGYEQRARELLLQKLDFLEIEANHNAIDRMDEFIALQRQHVKQAEELLEEAQEALAQVRMERKAQEILKEKAFEEFKQELNRAESKEIDELTSYTHGRRATVH